MTSTADARERSLREQIRSLPTDPGVYLFRDASGEILYVGKAKSVRARVRSYLRPDVLRSPKLAHLARRIHGVESFVAQSEAEALLLEWNLIKEHSPRFNIQLRDDKSYPYIKVTLAESFPRIFVTRRLKEDGSRYFGPFTDVKAMRRALRAIKRMYAIRSCHYDMPREGPPRPCLDYHIGRCKAPCIGEQTEDEYREMIEEVVEVLSGRTARVRRTVERRMQAAARTLEFERAAELRDVLRGLRAIESRQTAIDSRGGDHDVLGVTAEGVLACAVILRVREGRLVGRQVHYLENPDEESEAVVVGAFVKGFYLRQEEIAPELVVRVEFADREIVEEYLSTRRNGRFSVRIPSRGVRRQLLDAAERNAAHLLAQDRLRGGAETDGAVARGGDAQPTGDGSGRVRGVPEAAGRLAAALGLGEAPRTIACFDISTLAGSESVGSAVWLVDGRPRKDEYRRFKIRSVELGRTDDYAMMQEVVGRYFGRRVAEGKRLPDLVVIDGGKGQLAAALQAMEGSGVSDLPVVSLAKREEEVYLPGRSGPVRLRRTDPGLHWLQRARDEAHRFALHYNRALRRRRTLRSRLAEIDGVGPAREQELLRHFGSVDAMSDATEEELRRVPGIGAVTATRLREALAER